MTSVLESPLETLDFSVRAFNSIKQFNRNIKTIGDLVEYTKEDLIQSSCMGSRSIEEIIGHLRFVGLDLKKKFTLDDHIKEFDLSARLRNKLTVNGISTFRHILDNKEKLFAIEQLGQKCLSELDGVFNDSLGIKVNLLEEYVKSKKPKQIRMKLEITEEQKFNEPVWYFLRVNGVTVSCSTELDELETLYAQIKADPNLAFNKKIVLKSEEIDVNL